MNEEPTVEANGGPGGETPPVSAGQKMDEGLRFYSEYVFRPFLWPFTRLGISPNMLTCVGVALAIASGYFLAVERVPLAAVFFTMSGIMDLVDGYVAKKLDRVTTYGSFLDSFSDRVSDAAIYLGLMVYYLERGEGVYVGMALVLLVTSFLISYVRAKAEGFGLTCKAGLMARGPRFLALGFGLFFNGLSPCILRIVLWVVAVLLLETLIERLVEVWRALRE
ncbi:MAG: CDP-alcohol phosphatidyltransferase family protein [Actinobacteria bacterium]|nr:CDP-alcohol phosphatidyltransferase family protein [Actinomycetota bacterium]